MEKVIVNLKEEVDKYVEKRVKELVPGNIFELKENNEYLTAKTFKLCDKIDELELENKDLKKENKAIIKAHCKSMERNREIKKSMERIKSIVHANHDKAPRNYEVFLMFNGVMKEVRKWII